MRPRSTGHPWPYPAGLSKQAMNMRTRIKICGVTDPDTARVAVAAGADAIGLIFHPPSERHLQPARAAAICRVVGPFVSTVAVMVNPTAECVKGIIEQVNPSHLQFHGEEPADLCAAFGKPYIKTLRVVPGADLGKELRETEARYESARGILLDTHASDRYGGTGTAFDWGQVSGGGTMPVILAGGLTPENVAGALTEVAPYGVDVSTGVESDGRKDPEKIRRFCQTVHNPLS